jgi:hypothetical protein
LLSHHPVIKQKIFIFAERDITFRESIAIRIC